MSKFPLIAAALLAVPTPVLAQFTFVDDLTKFTPTKVEKAKSDLDYLECRNEDTLGSRLGKHQVCMTKQQWWTYEQEDKMRVHDWQVIGYRNDH